MTEMQDNPSTPSDGVRPNWTRRSALAVAGATAVAGAVMVLSAIGATTATADPTDNHKYFVCKYVGTPGVDERPQTGDNPISVSGNAIAETPVVVGSFFKDGQNNSFVLAEDVGQPEPDPSQCPAAPQPTETPTVTESVTPTVTESVTPTETETVTDTATSTETAPVTTTETVSGVVTTVVNQGGGGAAGQAVQGPIPAGVNAGLHTTDSNAGLKAWGIVLMLLGGAAGLIFGLRPNRGRAH